MSGKLNKKTAPAMDSRVDLGYGTLNPKFHLPRSSNSSFPYTDPDDAVENDVFVDEESIEAVNAKAPNFGPSDFLDKNKTDPFYYAGAATKLSEVNSAASITTRSKQSGSKLGWSKPTHPYELEDSLEDEDINLKRLRMVISNIHSQEQEAGR